MPRHDNHRRPELEIAVTLVFAIVLIAVLLWLNSYAPPVAPVPPM
jgi:hypothetical protein